MVEVTQTMFRRILIYALGAVFLTAGGVRAQQPEVEARIAGLEGNAEYMSLLREDAQLQIREDSIVNAVERMRRQLREDPGKRQQYSQEIAELRLRATATDLVVKSPAMQRLWTLILNTANTKANILITGETGVGKSAVAKAIHAISNRANGPFIEVNCAVLHERLIESEQNGYEMTELKAVEAVNERQKSILFHKLDTAWQHGLAGKTVTLWGLAFKPETDDMREAPSLVLIRKLLEAGCTVRVYDPEAMDECRRRLGDAVIYARDMYEAA